MNKDIIQFQNSLIKFQIETISSSDFITKKFFSDNMNIQLLFRYFITNSSDDWEQLLSNFRDFYFEIRFTKFLSSTIRFGYIDYQRKRKRLQSNSVIILDKEIFEEGDLKYDSTHSYNQYADMAVDYHCLTFKSLRDHLSNKKLYFAFCELTNHQQEILNYTYVYNYLDKEIAQRLCISPQAVSKARRNALARLKENVVKVGFCREKEA